MTSFIQKITIFVIHSSSCNTKNEISEESVSTGYNRYPGRYRYRTFFPSFAIQLKPLGDGFIKLIKMMIGPVIFCTIMIGIAGMENTRKVGRVGIKTIIYFEIISPFALIIGLIVINIIKPRVGMNIDPGSCLIFSSGVG